MAEYENLENHEIPEGELDSMAGGFKVIGYKRPPIVLTEEEKALLIKKAADMKRGRWTERAALMSIVGERIRNDDPRVIMVRQIFRS
ncbi:MAG: hypothetical protein IKG18_03325 [Atopobiaceae bacterium]|nr:hypothetical protein [Atopobiaceae bacterium]